MSSYMSAHKNYVLIDISSKIMKESTNEWLIFNKHTFDTFSQNRKFQLKIFTDDKDTTVFMSEH